MKIQKVAVIGSGVMGSGIAAHIANAGIPVILLDILPKDPALPRNAIAAGALEKLKKSDPAAFMHPKNADLVTVGNLEDDLSKLADCDWIIEAVVENLAIKHALYARLEGVRKEGSVVSSNTSTIPLHSLIEGQGERFAGDFIITHFFNPPRYMRLLEMVSSPKNRPEMVRMIADFCDVALGKGVVHCHDTPGFIANRIGTYWMERAVNGAFDHGLTVEEVDALTGKPLGIPKTATFGLIDLVGIDLFPHLATSMLSSLPPDDAYRSMHRDHALIGKMIADGYTGRKGKGGFTRMVKAADGSRQKETMDLSTGYYRAPITPALESVEAAKAGLQALATHPDKGGQFVWELLRDGLSYAADLVPDIADTIDAVDTAMRLGYNWKQGPFQMLDALGTGWFTDKLKAEGKPVPKMLAVAAGRPFYKIENGKRHFLTTTGEYAPVQRPDGVLLLSDIKLASKPVAKNPSASLWDIGDGVLCLEFTSKMNTMDGDIFALEMKAIEIITTSQSQFKALVIHNEADNFSVGANLGLAMFAVNIGMWDQVEQLIAGGQDTYKALKFAPFPVVAAPSGMALGGGCEILLHCDAVVAHAESYIGLVEAGVGFIPGWGGCKEMIGRHTLNKKRPNGPMPPLSATFETIAMAKVSKSAAEAKELLFLRPSDVIVMNRDRLLHDAKQKALKLAENYAPPEPIVIQLAGASGKAALTLAVNDMRKQGKVTPHDIVVTDALATVITGGDADVTDLVSEDMLTALERKIFLKLARTKGTMARVEHMLETGKPLRN